MIDTHDISATNRAASRLKLQDYAGALQDCEAALAVNQSSTKALYRRAQALLGVGGSKVSEAVKSLQLLIKSEPNNKDVSASVPGLQHWKEPVVHRSLGVAVDSRR
jgi:tetratricopeptide (TPR) repeat protein